MPQFVDELRHLDLHVILGRLATAGIVLAAFMALAWLSTRVVRLWLRRMAARRGPQLGDALVAAAGGGVTLFIILVGVYQAVEVLEVSDRALRWVDAAVYLVAAFVAVRVLIRIFVALLRHYFEHRADGPSRDRAAREYLPITTTGTTVAFALLGAITVAHHFGYEMTSLVAALGVGSLAIGLAAQQTLGNMFAGFVLLVDRPFRPGDRIRLASGETGEVAEIGIRSTKILLDEKNLLIVPNTELANSRVVNFEFPSSEVRGEVRVKVPLASDLDATIKLIHDLVSQDGSVLSQPSPVVRCVALDETGVSLAAHYAVATVSHSGAVADRVVRGVARALLTPRAT